MDFQIEKHLIRVTQYMITAARLLYAQFWKTQILPTIQEWLLKLMDMAENDKLTCLLKENSNCCYFKEWKPLVDYLQNAGGTKLAWGFED